MAVTNTGACVNCKIKTKKRTYTIPQFTEIIFNKSVGYGQAIKYNAYIERAQISHDTSDIYDYADIEVVFKLLFEYFVSKNTKMRIRDAYDVTCDEFKYVQYTRLAFGKTTNAELSRGLKKYYTFLTKLSVDDIKNVQVQHKFQRELLNKMLHTGD
jgi:hypothetical protein